MNSSSAVGVGSVLRAFAFDLGGELFQDRIGLHLLLDQIPQFEKRRLQDEQALLKLRRKNLLKREVLRLVHSRAGHDYRR